jgi:hypothetical protein
MKEITYNNQKKEIPDSLEELSPKEYYRYLELVLMMNAGRFLLSRCAASCFPAFWG